MWKQSDRDNHLDKVLNGSDILSEDDSEEIFAESSLSIDLDRQLHDRDSVLADERISGNKESARDISLDKDTISSDRVLLNDNRDLSKSRYYLGIVHKEWRDMDSGFPNASSVVRQ